jgi:hypothetical protein
MIFGLLFGLPGSETAGLIRKHNPKPWTEGALCSPGSFHVKSASGKTFVLLRRKWQERKKQFSQIHFESVLVLT